MFYNLKSRETLDSKPLQLDKMEVMSRNILYITHRLDKCLDILEKLQNDNHLQKQVDEYFEEEDKEHIPDSDPKELD